MNKLVSTLGITLLFFCACEPVNRYFSLPDDNIIEETSEFVIKTETGLNVDLTPSSPE
jgi:choline-glycine betaine transporter